VPATHAFPPITSGFDVTPCPAAVTCWLMAKI
jgi:hypothetical protein